MREVENYVEHIRHLSDEREALIQELETENEQLKNDLEQVRSELSGESERLCVCVCARSTRRRGLLSGIPNLCVCVLCARAYRRA